MDVENMLRVYHLLSVMCSNQLVSSVMRQSPFKYQSCIVIMIIMSPASVMAEHGLEVALAKGTIQCHKACLCQRTSTTP